MFGGSCTRNEASPTLIAMQIRKSFKGVVMAAAVVAVVNFVLGLVISYFAVLPTGATVVAVNLVGLFIALLWRNLKNKD